MDTQTWPRYAALPEGNTAGSFDELVSKYGGKLELAATRAESSTWGLTGDNYIVASLLKFLAQRTIEADELSRKLAGAQMKLGRLEKQHKVLEERHEEFRANVRT